MRQAQLQLMESQNNRMAPVLEHAAMPAPAARPPPARPILGTSDSDNKSIVSMFKRPPDNRYIPLNIPKDQQKVRRHPDALYFNARDTDATPTANAFPTAIDNDKRNRNVCGRSDRIEITHIPERNVVQDKERSCTDACWWAFSRLCTILIPNFALFWVGRDVMVKKGMSREAKKEAIELRKEAKQAWREKVAICIIQMAFCAAFL